VITGAHAIVYADDVEAARAFFRDVLGFDAVDAGDGWLIFGLPPAELACHPVNGTPPSGGHTLFFLCDDVRRTVDELSARGVEFTTGITDEGWGLLTHFRVPGAGEIGLYEPRHPSPLIEP
jgi:catechol 2,3-dioxygenase-like lactoylglutathione lyase family enzyme